MNALIRLSCAGLLVLFFLRQPAAAQDRNLATMPAGRKQRVERGQQLAESMDLGDSYPAPQGRRQLRRLMGEIAVRLDDPADEPNVLEALTGIGKPLAGYTVDRSRGKGILVFQAQPAERRRQRADPSRHTQAVAAARQTSRVRAANPVFVEPLSGLWMIPTGEIVIRLNADTDPRSYFGADWPKVRTLPGTREHFALARPTATFEELFAEVTSRMNDRRVKWAEPDFLCEVVKHRTPNDPLFPSQWHLNNIGQNSANPAADVNAPQAWDITTGSPDIVIAIIDDGIQLTHPDLASNIFSNAGELANNADDDNNGYRDDFRGWDFFDGDNDPSPADFDDNHGTSTAGMAAARGDNSLGIAGIAYRCSILPVKVIKGPNLATTSGLAQAIRYAGGIDGAGVANWRGADVISISLGFPQASSIDDALADAAVGGRNGRGCPVFASAGNDASGWFQSGLYGLRAGTHTFKWQYIKDDSDLFDVGADAAWLDSVSFPGGTVERFEAGSVPSGWILTGNAWWSSVQDGASGNHALTGWSGPGSRAVRAGRVLNNQATTLTVTKLNLPAGDFSYWSWVSSEWEFDFLDFYVDNVLYDSFSGVPVISTATAYPANHPSVIGVGASTDFDYRADYSQYGAGLEFVAPSSGAAATTLTTDRTGADGFNPTAGTGGDYMPEFGGTSSSCPLAAGVAALMLSVNPGLTATEVRDLMRRGCDQIGNVTYSGGRNPFYGSGRLNALKSVSLAQIDLAVSQTVSSGTVQAGGDLTYTITVTNKNLATAASVTLIDNLSSILNLTSATSTRGSVTNIGAALIVHLGDFSNGSVATVTLVARTLSDGTATNSAAVSANGTDAFGGDNTSLITVRVTPAADLVLSQAPIPATVDLGQNLMFQLVVTNRGPSTATNVTVTDTLPGGANLVSASVSQGDYTSDSNQVSASLGAMTNGAVATLSIVVAPTASGLITNRATVTASVPELYPADNVTAAFTTVNQPPRPDLAVSHSNRQVTFNWPTNATGFRLEFTANLGPPVTWIAAPETPVVSGDHFSVTLDTMAGTRFYRLINN